MEKKKIVKSESETADILIKFFSNILKNLGITDYDNFDPNIENMKDPVFKAIFKYKNYPSILAIRDTRKNSIFCLKEVTIEEIEKKINKLSSKKDLKIVIQWNLSKTDTYGTEDFVRFTEVSGLDRFELKSSQI